MAKIHGRVSYRLAGGESLDRLLDLLAAVSEAGSLAVAATRLRLSYRNAWGLLSAWQQRLGQPLLHMTRGRGSQLAPLGQRLLEAERAAHRALEPQLALAVEQMHQALSAGMAVSKEIVRLHASHDLALEILPGLLSDFSLELSFRGSMEALEDYAARRCELAGVHCPQGEIGDAIRERYRRALRGREHRAILFARRSQGLMVAPGNPAGIRDVGDLQRPGLRFVNRQSGAGTRLLLDLLLAGRGISPSMVPGYARTEFTHAAVAAMIAAGTADAGLGIRAAAQRFGLDFVPLLEEDYFLLGRARDQQKLEGLCEALQGAPFRTAAAELGGYDLSGAGRMLKAEEAFRPAVAA